MLLLFLLFCLLLWWLWLWWLRWLWLWWLPPQQQPQQPQQQQQAQQPQPLQQPEQSQQQQQQQQQHVPLHGLSRLCQVDEALGRNRGVDRRLRFWIGGCVEQPECQHRRSCLETSPASHSGAPRASQSICGEGVGSWTTTGLRSPTTASNMLCVG